MSHSGHTDKINALAVSKDECFLLSGSKDKTVVLWDLKESGSGLGGKIKRFEEHSRPVLGVVYQEYEYKVLSMDTNQIVVSRRFGRLGEDTTWVWEVILSYCVVGQETIERFLNLAFILAFLL